MTPSSKEYRDLIWHFMCLAQCIDEKAPNDSGQVMLRVFSSEDKFFRTEPPGLPDRPTQAFPIRLPLDRLKEMKVSRGEVTQSWQSSSVLMEMGRQLWEAIPDEAKQTLHEASAELPCRLKISSDSPLIDNLPWEWLSDATGPLALRPEVRLARSVPIRIMPPPLTVEPPLRVLLVITNPKDERSLNPDQEIKAVIQELQAPQYKVQYLENPTWEALETALKEECHILHYIGHAGLDRGEGSIILHDYNNVTHWICGSELSKALPLTVRLLCLSTCFTAPNYQILGLPRLAHAPASYRLPTTVTNSAPVDEMSVKTFWKKFYSSLTQENGNVNEAFHGAQGDVAANSPGNAFWGSFSLVIRDQSGEAFRLEGASPRDKEQLAAEIKAQLASTLANELSMQLSVFGDKAPDSMRKTVEKEITRAADLTKKVL